MAAAPSRDLLEVFENPRPGRAYEIVHVADEFTSLCPLTGHPDFASIEVRFVPDATCVELKSLKLYLQAYRQEGAFYEAVVNRICDDLAHVMAPRTMTVIGRFRGRGGIRSEIAVSHPEVHHPEARQGDAREASS